VARGASFLHMMHKITHAHKGKHALSSHNQASQYLFLKAGVFLLISHCYWTLQGKRQAPVVDQPAVVAKYIYFKKKKCTKN
jgi:hypothetical protein